MSEFKRRESMRTSAAAKEMDVTPRTILRWCDEGKLDSFTLPGGQRRVYRDSLLALMGEEPTDAA